MLADFCWQGGRTVGPGPPGVRAPGPQPCDPWFEGVMQSDHRVYRRRLDVRPLLLVVSVAPAFDRLADPAGTAFLQALPLQLAAERLLDGIPVGLQRAENPLVLLLQTLVDVKLGVRLV